MEERYDTPSPVAVIAAVLAVALGFFLLWAQLGPVVEQPAPWAQAPVPTLQPTPPIAVPPPAPVAPPPPAVYVERVESGGNVVINNNTTNVDICISLRCD